MTQFTVEAARKRRHLELLKKVQDNRPLSSAELRELESYEQPSSEPAIVDPGPRVKIKWKRRDRRKKNPRPPVSQAVIKRLAFEVRSLAHGDARIECERSLVELLEEWPVLQAAWDRGQFLQNLQGYAADIMTVTQAAKKLGMDKGQDLRRLLDTDPEAYDLWEQTKIETIHETKRALREAVRAGNQTAIRVVEAYLKDDSEVRNTAGSSVSFEAVPITMLAPLFGVRRQAVLEWYKKQGLPRNADDTFDLATTIAWYKEFILRKQTPGRGALNVADQDKLQKIKIRELEFLERKGDLVQRPAAINLFVSIVHIIRAELDRIVRDVAPTLANKPPKIIEEKLAKSRAEILQKLRQNADAGTLRLSPVEEQKFIEFYEVLCPECIDGSNNDN